MQIILKEDVKDLGRSGEMVNVAEGYARNYLLPRKLAVTATPGNLKDLHKRIGAAKEREAREREDAEAVMERIRATRLTLTGRAAEGSTRLHGSITAENVAAALSHALGHSFDKRSVELKNPIRTLGTHQVAIRLLKGLTAPVTVDVVDAAQQAEEAARAAASPPAAPAAPAAAAMPAAAAETVPAAAETGPAEIETAPAGPVAVPAATEPPPVEAEAGAAATEPAPEPATA